MLEPFPAAASVAFPHPFCVPCFLILPPAISFCCEAGCFHITPGKNFSVQTPRGRNLDAWASQCSCVCGARGPGRPALPAHLRVYARARVCVYGLTQFCVHNSFASCVHDTDTLLKNENCCLLNHRCWAPIRRHRPWPGAEGTRDRDGATALRRTASGLNLVARCDEWAVQGPNQFYKKFKLW